MREKEHTGGRVIEIVTIVTSNSRNYGAKLSGDKSKKVSKSEKSIKFSSKTESPKIMETIIKGDKIIFVA